MRTYMRYWSPVQCVTFNFFVAGDQVTVEMHQQPNDRSCANEAIGVSNIVYR